MVTNDPPTQTDVFTALEQLAKIDASLTLTRLFEGVLLAQEVHILSVCQDTAVCKASDLKLIAAPGGRKIHLHAWAFTEPIRARLHKCIPATSTFILEDFAWVYTGWCERSGERVQPQTPVYASLTGPFGEVRAAIMDVAVDGIGILTKRCPEAEEGMVAGESVQVAFTFPPQLKWQRLPGTIVNQAPVNNSLNRVGIRLQPKRRQVHLLEQYTTRRKEEILADLDLAYRQVQGPRRVEDLFF